MNNLSDHFSNGSLGMNINSVRQFSANKKARQCLALTLHYGLSLKPKTVASLFFAITQRQ
ncbi:Uncharacterised protein [Shewanella baltica]|nr:Uncharacterised protein [Shewanella baltica]